MFVLPLAATLRRWEGSRFRHRPPCGRLLELTSFCRQLFLLDTQKEPKRCPLLPIAREARLKGNGSRVARAALRAVSLKNPRADGLAPTRGQHSTVGRFAISIICCSFLVVRRGRRPRRPGGFCVVAVWVVGWYLCWSVGRGLDPSLRSGGYVRLHGRI